METAMSAISVKEASAKSAVLNAENKAEIVKRLVFFILAAADKVATHAFAAAIGAKKR